MEDLHFDESAFSGRTRLFPLPNHVMFPHVMQPLHVFESRYRDLVQNALQDDRLITLATLTPGWEKDYESRPAIRPIACLCRLVAHHQQEDGKYNILLAGVRRVRLSKELPAMHSFRVAECEILNDLAPISNDDHVRLHRRLIKHFEGLLPDNSEAANEFKHFLSESAPLGPLTDILAHMLPLEISTKEKLLAELRVETRAEVLLKHLQEKGNAVSPFAETPNRFPPDFSAN